MPKKIEFYGLTTIPEVQPGDDLTKMIVEAAAAEGVTLEENDIVVITSKIISKAEGLLVDLASLEPSPRAKAIAWATGKDAAEIELYLRIGKAIVGYIPVAEGMKFLAGRKTKGPAFLPYLQGEEAKEVIGRVKGLLLVEMPNGVVATDAGVDASNVAGMTVMALLPDNPDAIAAKIRERIHAICGRRVAVVLADTELRILRFGTTDVAVGVAGMQPIRQQFGKRDMYGKPKFGGLDAVADEVVAGASLLMGQTAERVPVVIVRGADYEVGEHVSGVIPVPGDVIVLGFLYALYSRLKIGLAQFFSFFFH